MVLSRPANGTVTPPAPLLEVRGATHRFGTTVALDDASIQVRAGTIHALLGENGAGKTTLMRVAFGLVAADAGTVLVDGRPVAIRTPSDAIGHGIGMVHQHFNLIPAMAAAANVALGGHGLLDLRAVQRDLARLSSDSGLPIDPDALVETLSVAQQQRLEILKALYRDARVLILDEPTAVLAPAEADELLRWLRGYVARGNAVVLITHKLHEAVAVADDVTVLRRGRVVLHTRGSDATASAPTPDLLAAAMLGEAAPATTAAREAIVRASGAVVVRMDAVSARRGRESISNATAAICAGDVVGIAGIEGSGHQLLTLLLAGRLVPDAGIMLLPDTIGYIPEDRHRDAVAAERSLTENVALRGAASRRGFMQWSAWRERTDALVARYDVRGPGDGASMGALPVQVLSGGNQQKLVIARELGEAPQLVVAEHPTRGLDVRAAAAVRQRLRDAARDGAAVVVYSPDLDEVLAMADRVLVVHGGTVTECACDRDAVGRWMLGLA
jgi:ABC-type uncharacterized transport system ATPase subunit